MKNIAVFIFLLSFALHKWNLKTRNAYLVDPDFINSNQVDLAYDVRRDSSWKKEDVEKFLLVFLDIESSMGLANLVLQELFSLVLDRVNVFLAQTTWFR
jgi:hypothetical protein